MNPTNLSSFKEILEATQRITEQSDSKRENLSQDAPSDTILPRLNLPDPLNQQDTLKFSQNHNHIVSQNKL